MAIGHPTASVAARPAVGGGRAPETPLFRDGIDVFRIEGRIEASALNRIRKLVESDPERGLGVIRSWLHEKDAADRRRKQLKIS